MLNRARELIFSLVAMVFITVVYLLLMTTSRGVPMASDLYGHGMGIVGFVMMVMTETLYSLRKRWKGARWGRMAEWLEFHIFTGLVGPYLVLLHSAWSFNGLAGVVLLLTAMIVLSGVVGRYFYTAVPRTMDGVEVSLDELDEQSRELAAQVEEAYARLHGEKLDGAPAAAQAGDAPVSAAQAEVEGDREAAGAEAGAEAAADVEAAVEAAETPAAVPGPGPAAKPARAGPPGGSA